METTPPIKPNDHDYSCRCSICVEWIAEMIALGWTIEQLFPGLITDTIQGATDFVTDVFDEFF